MHLGDTFVIEHLWIVISDPSENGGSYVIANLTKNKERAGTDCELRPSDHPWIREKCFVSFGDARKVGQEEEAQIVKHISNGTIRSNCPLKSHVIKKIIAAARQSEALPIELKPYFETKSK